MNLWQWIRAVIKKKKKGKEEEETRSMLCHRNPEKRMFHEPVKVDNRKCYKK